MFVRDKKNESTEKESYFCSARRRGVCSCCRKWGRGGTRPASTSSSQVDKFPKPSQHHHQKRVEEFSGFPPARKEPSTSSGDKFFRAGPQEGEARDQGWTQRHGQKPPTSHDHIDRRKRRLTADDVKKNYDAVVAPGVPQLATTTVERNSADDRDTDGETHVHVLHTDSTTDEEVVPRERS